MFFSVSLFYFSLLCLYSVFNLLFSNTSLFHHHTPATPVLSPSSSSPCPTCLRTAVTKNRRKRRRIFLRFSLGPGTCANECCMLQRAAWQLTATPKRMSLIYSSWAEFFIPDKSGDKTIVSLHFHGILSIP